LSQQQELAANAARQEYLIGSMNHQVQNLPERGFIAPGAFDTQRLEIAKAAQALTHNVFGKDIFDPNQIGAAEEMAKDTNKLGYQLSNSMPGTHASDIIGGAIHSTPGIDNTAAGYKRIASSVGETINYEKDKAAFYQNFMSKFGHLEGAREEFERLNPVENYVRRAIVNSVDPVHLQRLRAYAAEHSGKDISQAHTLFDGKYGKGAANIVLGQ
jgi:hypothetical protein